MKNSPNNNLYGVSRLVSARNEDEDMRDSVSNPEQTAEPAQKARKALFFRIPEGPNLKFSNSEFSKSIISFSTPLAG